MLPRTTACRLRNVVSPNDLLLRAYSALPIRRLVTSSRRTTVATTRSWVSSSDAEIAVDASAKLAERRSERDQIGELVVGPVVDEGLVIAVLLAPTSVATGGLQMAVGIGGNPHVGPGRRHSESLDSLELALLR